MNIRSTILVSTNSDVYDVKYFQKKWRKYHFQERDMCDGESEGRIANNYIYEREAREI
jgi:hypothetical protein